MEEVEEMDLDHYLRLAEQFKPVLGPGHYQLVMIRRFIHTITGSKPGQSSSLIGPDTSRYCVLIGGTLLCWHQGLCHNNTPQVMGMRESSLD